MATDTAIASSCEPNDRARDTSTSDPTLESGDPITRIVAASPDCTCAENPSGNTTPPSMSPSSASRSTCAGESASRSVTKSRLVNTSVNDDGMWPLVSRSATA